VVRRYSAVAELQGTSLMSERSQNTSSKRKCRAMKTKDRHESRCRVVWSMTTKSLTYQRMCIAAIPIQCSVLSVPGVLERVVRPQYRSLERYIGQHLNSISAPEDPITPQPGMIASSPSDPGQVVLHRPKLETGIWRHLQGRCFLTYGRSHCATLYPHGCIPSTVRLDSGTRPREVIATPRL
jgi:hypothetical protein